MSGRIENISVFGAGLMGTGIAQVFAVNGYNVTVYDNQASQLKKVHDNVRSTLKLMAAHGVGRESEIDAAVGRIKTVVDFEEAARADFAVECIPENLELKQNLFKNLDLLCPPENILATNTSVISITQIASQAVHKGRILGTHWWNPPFLIPLVEVIRTEDTQEEVMETTVDLLQRIGKRAVRVNKDVPGFVANRMQNALAREALSIVEKGIADPETVDDCIKYGFGMRLPKMGIFEQIDMIGADLSLAVHSYIFKHLENSPEASPLLVEKVKKGDLGFKTGRGFRDWPPEAIGRSRKSFLEYLLKYANEFLKN